MLTKTMEQPAEIENQSNEAQDDATENAVNDLNAPVWSVISFDKRLARNLTYQQAIEKLNEFFAAKVSGLCIITDEAAARIGEKNS